MRSNKKEGYEIPDLTFPMVEYGRIETPWDFGILLYKGGASENARRVAEKINSGSLGGCLVERLDVVTKIHAELVSRLAAGGSKYSAFCYIRQIRSFFSWVDLDINSRALTLDRVEATYRVWTDYLSHCIRQQILTRNTAYTRAVTVANILDCILDRSVPLVKSGAVAGNKGPRRRAEDKFEKQNLSKVFEFGRLLLDIISSLSGNAIWGELPIKIYFRSGCILEAWSGLKRNEKLAAFGVGYKNNQNIKRAKDRRASCADSRPLHARYPLANIRIQAELLLFIAQTGMNLAQAHQLKISQYSYKSTIDGYEVRDYKSRRRGEVLFEIFEEYKKYFEDYLAWRNDLFFDSDDLFPFVRDGGRAFSTRPSFDFIARRACKATGVEFVSPAKLRKSRINWLLRKAGDTGLTADCAQHSVETLIRVYEQPSQQIAISEIVQFWPVLDPHLLVGPMPCPAPGVCDGVPTPNRLILPDAPKPDCKTPSGCLFCEHHRDIDSQDYVWSVASMRYLKTVVIQSYPQFKKDGASLTKHVECAIDILTAKIRWFEGSNALRKSWVHEALERIGERDFHPHWAYLINSAQGG